MSWKISGQVWEIELPANKLIVLLAMADHADHEGNNVYPSVGLIAWKTGYSERQAQRIIKALVADGLLVENKRPGQTTLYSINLSKGTPKDKYKPADNKGRQNVTPDIAMSPHPRHSYVTPTPDIAMSPEQSFEQSMNNHIAPADADASRPSPQDADTAIYGAPEKPARKRDELFDAVARHVFGIQDANALNGQGGRIAAIANWLKGKPPAKAAKARGVGQLDTAATVEDVQRFAQWYQGKYRGATLPHDVGKFAEHFLAYRAGAAPKKVVGGILDMSDIAPDDPDYYRIQTERMREIWQAQQEGRLLSA